ncbi:patatin-like phospholipase family protein [Derxia gummosa]|uniref:Patatin-like phospholipase family protein n=1 Tax=Derxia gummosa DSM 723 TaxID=1121388 RepID=A0A8B6XAH5_9BURK|nr:patatin-like phospholipase family protein [Derxia gummosa]
MKNTSFNIPECAGLGRRFVFAAVTVAFAALASGCAGLGGAAGGSTGGAPIGTAGAAGSGGAGAGAVVPGPGGVAAVPGSVPGGPAGTVVLPAGASAAHAPVRVGLALGGGAARGFAHIGVIKVLEAQGITVDYIAGTSAGSVVGSLYASGLDGYGLQQMALTMDESLFADWTFGGRSMFRGEAIATWINRTLGNKSIEQLKRPFGIVATRLSNGEGALFQRGNVGTAVRASSAVPGVFSPVTIGGVEYVDGGLTSPVPVRAVRRMGADFVIAVDISTDPVGQPTSSVTDLLLQTFTIMGKSINRFELGEADVVIRPPITSGSADFGARHQAILAGEKAATAALPELRQKLAARRAGLAAVVPAR